MKNLEALEELRVQMLNLSNIRDVIEALDDVDNDVRIELVNDIDYFLFNLENRIPFIKKDVGLQRELEGIEEYLDELNDWLQWR